MKLYLIAAAALLFSACSHTIDLRSAHFLTPMTSNEQWGGSLAVSASQPTKVTLVDNITANPPTRTGVKINEDVDPGDVLLFNYIGLDLRLAVLPGVEAVLDNHTFGLKWQFLNHQKDDAVLASVLAAYGTRDDETTSGSAESKTRLATYRGGLSVGYGFKGWAPYVSYVYDEYKARTEVQNSSGSFGPYEDTGKHHNYSVGLSTRGPGLNAALEYNYLVMRWNDGGEAYQDSVGVLLGVEW